MTLTKPKDDSQVNVGVWSLWAIGVGAFMGGDFVGWPCVLEGGFASGVLSVSVMGFYFWMIGKVAGDLSARFREPGGTYMFCRRVYGHRISPFIAIMQSVKLLVSNCTMALAISSYVQQITYHSNVIKITTWILCYVGCTLLDVVGIKVSANAQISIVIICLIVIIIFFLSASTLFNFRENSLGEEGWFKGGINGFMMSLPFGMWFLDGFEELPLAINFASDMGTTVPTAMSMSWMTAITNAILLMLFGSAATPMDQLISAPAPLMPAIQLVWGKGSFMTILIDCCIVLGLTMSFYSFVFFIGQTIQAIASDRILPSFLAELHPKYETASNASIISSIIGFITTFCFGLIFGESSAQKLLIVCSLLAAIISYYFLFGCLSIILKVEQDDILKKKKNIKPNNYNDMDITSELSADDASRTDTVSSGTGYCGHNPGVMAFPLGRVGAIFGQFTTILLLMVTLSLAGHHADYRVGVTVIVVLCVVIFITLQLNNYLCSNNKTVESDLFGNTISSMDQSTNSLSPLYVASSDNIQLQTNNKKSRMNQTATSSSTSTSNIVTITEMNSNNSLNNENNNNNNNDDNNNNITSNNDKHSNIQKPKIKSKIETETVKSSPISVISSSLKDTEENNIRNEHIYTLPEAPASQSNPNKSVTTDKTNTKVSNGTIVSSQSATSTSLNPTSTSSKPASSSMKLNSTSMRLTSTPIRTTSTTIKPTSTTTRPNASAYNLTSTSSTKSSTSTKLPISEKLQDVNDNGTDVDMS